MLVDYSFSLGKIGVLEKKLLSAQSFYELLKFCFPKDIGKIREAFFLSPPSEFSIKELEDFLNKEKIYLISILEKIVEEEFKVLFYSLEDVDSISKNLESIKSEALKKYLRFYVLLKRVYLDLRAQYLKRERRKVGSVEDFKEEVREFVERAERFLKEKDFYLLDFLFTNRLLKIADSLKREFFSPAIVFWYYLNKSFQYDLLKFVIVSILKNVNKEKIKKALEVCFG